MKNIFWKENVWEIIRFRIRSDWNKVNSEGWGFEILSWDYDFCWNSIKALHSSKKWKEF